MPATSPQLSHEDLPPEGARMVRRPPGEGLAASPRYHVYDLHSALLPDDRCVIVYLPQAYEAEPERRFPVFYLHDGQNLFDGRTSYVPDCTWRAHTTADTLTEGGEVEPVILVGVYNAGRRRMAEYTPTRDWRLGGGEGGQYGRLLIEELKPFLEGEYRILTGPAHTGLGGSSLGGLITLALGLDHPDVFGRLAVMSPSIWWDQRSILQRLNRLRARPELRIWLDMGTAEGMRHLREADALHGLLLRLGWREEVDLRYVRAEGAAHDEGAWAARFGDVLRFLFPARG